jgi:hypothetical protein
MANGPNVCRPISGLACCPLNRQPCERLAPTSTPTMETGDAMKDDSQAVQSPKTRALGYELARELSEDDLRHVAGGGPGPTPEYTPTGNPESDCD